MIVLPSCKTNVLIKILPHFFHLPFLPLMPTMAPLALSLCVCTRARVCMCVYGLNTWYWITNQGLFSGKNYFPLSQHSLGCLQFFDCRLSPIRFPPSCVCMPIAVTLVQVLFRQIWVEISQCSLPVISRRPNLPAAYNVSLSLDVP